MTLGVPGSPHMTMMRLGKRGGAWLACDRDGVALGPAVLVASVEATGRRLYRRRGDAEIAHILDLAYGKQAPRDLARRLSSLDVAVRALSDGNLPLAGIATVLLKLPPLTTAAFRKLAQIEGLVKYSPDQSRDERGRWSSEGGGSNGAPKTFAKSGTRLMMRSRMQQRVCRRIPMKSMC